ncbi:MAG TPA: CocE/NonD family hydrolase [Pyrinomonadaceae bacterium]|nr:CocE/NonD family hydrolase [Pyrinomonadaceae bacterium]
MITRFFSNSFRFVIVLFVASIALTAQTQQPPDPPAGFDKIEEMVPMRDGVKLHTIIYAPKSHKEQLPILLNRTPYGIDNIYRGFVAPSSLQELIDEGFIFAFQDIRGKFKSEGQFVMTRPPRGPQNSTPIDEGTDTYDTIDWMLKNVPHNNGRVGMFGTSYPGWLVVMSVIDPHPALKAVSEQATPADMFLGDDFHHNGAFRLAYGFEYAYALESAKTVAPFKFDRFDTYQWFLDLGALANADAKYFHGKLPTWTNFVSHPNYDEFWQQQALINQLKPTKVPIIHVAGWWDQEDFYGPVKAYEILEKTDTNHMNYLVVGPWNHGGWNRLTGDKLGNIDFGSPASQYFRANILRPWFAYHLKDKGKLNQPEAITFETGSNKWTSFDTWPPRSNVTQRNLYFQANRQLSFDPPKGAQPQFDAYVSDPAHPVPYRQRPVEPLFGGASRWPTWLVEDQRQVDNRSDVLTWETEPLTEDTVIAGDIVAHLFASTSGTDSDWVVKLIDVYPEEYPKDIKMGGYELMIADEILRGRFRNSFTKPEPIPANQVVPYTIDLHTNNHAFLKGHRIMVQVHSTWFPVYDRNPQKFVPNIFMARDSDYLSATQRIFRSSRYPSHVTVSVLTQAAAAVGQ